MSAIDTVRLRSSTDQRGYEIVGPTSMPFLTWLAAERTLLHCEHDLGLSGIRIVWIRPTHTAVARMEQTLERLAHLAGDHEVEAQAFLEVPNMQGQARSLHEKEIRVRADLSITETIKTIAHELKHLADYAKFRWPETDVEHETFERRAREYECGAIA